MFRIKNPMLAEKFWGTFSVTKHPVIICDFFLKKYSGTGNRFIDMGVSEKFPRCHVFSELKMEKKIKNTIRLSAEKRPVGHSCSRPKPENNCP